MPEPPESRTEQYRGIARELRQIAEGQRFDLCRHDQLMALAEGFERLADRIAGEPQRVIAG